jgi:hypothetical protein
MSFVITAYVREGIVMASDSRLTLNAMQDLPSQGPQVVQLAVAQSDSNYKTFLALDRYGISTCGAADIGGVPIAGFIESFIAEGVERHKYEIDAIPKELLLYFRSMSHPPASTFHIAGYKQVNHLLEQQVWVVSVGDNTTTRLNPKGEYSISWSGEGDVMARLLLPAAQADQQGKHSPFPQFNIPYQFFTLQDAIDFCIYSVRTTIETIRFQPRPKSVGGPIDVLVIKPTGATWVQKKELRGEH